MSRRKVDYSKAPTVERVEQEKIDKCAEIIKRIAQGENAIALQKEYGINNRLFYRIIVQNPELSRMHQEAREQRAHYLLDEAMSIADDFSDCVLEDKEGNRFVSKDRAMQKRMQIDCRRFEAARWLKRVNLTKAGGTIREQAEEIVKLLAEGKVDVELAQSLLQIYESVQRVLREFELDERVRRLEQYGKLGEKELTDLEREAFKKGKSKGDGK